MGWFSKKKDHPAPGLTRVASNGSAQSSSKIKLLLKPKQAQPEPPTSTANGKPEARRVSTIIEDEQHADFGGDDYENDHDDSSDFESEDDDYEEHTHVMLARPPVSESQLTALKNMCGLGLHSVRETLQQFANAELKRTFSLLTSDRKIHRLSPTMNKTDPHLQDSVIGDFQMELINELTAQLNTIMSALHDLDAQYLLVKSNRTLHDRYGNVKDVIGRGAYGVIKIIDSDVNRDGFALKNKVYAVKELHRSYSKDSKAEEPQEKFIERVVSEFIISSTLNSKHIVRTIDFLLTLPPIDPSAGVPDPLRTFKISQVMECTSGGDLFSYIKKLVTLGLYLSIDEIDCMIKQITKGLWYMHNHGVAHCDLKLENILITYNGEVPKQGHSRGQINLKISDFGKSSVVRTMWDDKEQLQTSLGYPVGSEPYMAPEEYITSKHGHSLLKKDCWALGIMILILFNIKRSYFVGRYGEFCHLDYYDKEAHEEASKTYSSSYLWRSTEVKTSTIKHQRKYKDEGFAEYVNNAMLADYDKTTKEWTIKRPGTFLPIESIFEMPKSSDDEAVQRDLDFEDDDFILRKYFIYKLLDVNPKTRATVDMLLTSDWIKSVECCCE